MGLTPRGESVPTETRADQKLSRQIIKTLGEKQAKPIAQVHNIVRLCGHPFAEIMLETAIAIEDDGGMMTQDGKRSRTLGGIFFFLVRGALPDDLRHIIFPDRRAIKPTLEAPPIIWQDRKTHFVSVLDKPKGKVEKVNISIEGRPQTIEVKQGLVLATLEAHIEVFQTFPRGMPDVPADPTTFFVYVGEAQWDKNVADKLDEDEGASIVVDGAPSYDAEMGGIAIFARSVKVRSGAVNRKTEEIREQRRKNAEEAKKQAQKHTSSQPLPKQGDIPSVEEYAPEIAKKLRPLYGARLLFRKRIADIQALPEEKQRGLKAQQMGLARVEKQIEALEMQGKPDDKQPTDTTEADDDA
jgi:hypothetical protein